MKFEEIIKDTHPQVANIQIGLLRDSGQVRRSRLMLSLTQSAFQLSRRNLNQKHPHLSELEKNIKFVELLYGSDLADSLRKFLKIEQS